MLNQHLGFIGAGQMARALAGAFVAAEKLEAQQIVAYDPSPEAIQGFRETIPAAGNAQSDSELVASCEVIFLAVKPQVMPAVMSGLAGQLNGKLVVSIAAGVTLDRLSEGLATRRIIRVMPNTPCLIGRGACGFSLGEEAGEADRDLVKDLLAAVGVAFEVPERLLDAVTGLSGSGPAYVYTLIEALSDGGVRMGLPRQIASSLAAETVRGAAEMVATSEQHPALLREQVTSPGGTTIAGLQALEDGGFRAACMAAVQAATERSQQLAES